MAINFSNGFRIGAGTPPQSLSFFTDLRNIATYLRDYMSDFRNPDFYEYLLDGDGFHIYDGDNDMYDRGNATSPWLRSNVPQTGTTSYDSISDYPYAIDYTTTGSTGTMDTTFGYLSLGYNSPNLLPLTVIGTRATIASPGDPIGFQVGGNIGADGSGIHVDGNIYTGDNVSGFTVHAFYSETYDAGDPSVCDVFILLGHPSWNSVFGNVYYGADNSNDGNSSFLYTSGNGATNILAIKTLLSKYNGSSEITFSEVQTVVDNFIIRIGELLSNTPTATPNTTPTPTATTAPLSQFTPNGTSGSNGLITYLNYTAGINASNLLPDLSPANNEFAYVGTNPYTNGVTGYTFTGSGSYAYAANANASYYNLGFSSLTIEMWVKIPTIQGSMSLISAGGNSSGGWALRIDGAGSQLNLVKYNIADQTVNLPYTLQANTWYHIVVAQGGTSLTYIINGEIVGAVNTGASNNFNFPNGTVNIGIDNYTNTNYAMTLGTLKVYDFCRLFADIVSEFNNTGGDYGYSSPTPTPSSTPEPTPTDTPAPTPTDTPSPTPTDTSSFVLTCYTVRQHLYDYSGGSNNADIYVVTSDYPDVATIPVGATATIGGIGVTVTAVSSSNSPYLNGNPGYIIGLDVSTAIWAGTTVQFCWMAAPTPTPTSTPAASSTPAPTASSTPAPTASSTPAPTATAGSPTPTPTATTPTGFTINVYESGSNVVMSASGALDISSLSLVTSNGGPSSGGGLGVNNGTFLMGANGGYFDEYSGLTSTPSNFGTGGGLGSTSGSGSIFGVIMQGAPPYHLLVPAGYTSGTQISSSQTFTGQTLSSLGLTNGTYTFNWGSDSINVVVGLTPAVTPTPTSGGSGSNSWYFYTPFGDNLTTPPLSNGQTLFYTTAGGPPVSKANPNSDGYTYLTFYKNDSTGTSYETQFNNLVATGGTINVTQNGQTATYTSNTPGAFFVDNAGFLVFSANIQTATVANPFTYTDPISITFGS